MTKTIVIRLKMGGTVRCLPTTIGPRMTDIEILSRWRLEGCHLQDAVTRYVFPRRSEIFFLVEDGQILEPVEDYLLAG